MLGKSLQTRDRPETLFRVCRCVGGKAVRVVPVPAVGGCGQRLTFH